MARTPEVCPDCGAENFSCRTQALGTPQILTLEEQRRRAATMPMITLRERVYVDAKGRATTDPEKADRLWGTPGLEVQEADALAIGYMVPEAKAVRRPKGTKVIEGPAGDK
jgi:hypothetical protein